MTDDEKALGIAALVIALLERRGDICYRSSRSRKGDPGLQGPPGHPGAKGDKGEKGDKGDRGFKGDPGVSPAFYPSAWRIYVDFSSTNPIQDGTEHAPYHNMAQAMARWAALNNTTAAHILVGGSGGAESDPVTVPDNCHGTIEGIERTWPTLGSISIAANDGNGRGAVSLRNLGCGSITLRDRVAAQPGDLGIVALACCWVTGDIESLPGQHTAFVVASGLSQVTPQNLSPSMVIESGTINLRAGFLIADNARVLSALECGAFHMCGGLFVGTVQLRTPPNLSRFIRMEFQDPFTIDSDTADSEVWFDAQSAERFGLIGANCTSLVNPLSNGFGPMLRRLGSNADPFAPVYATSPLIVEPAGGVADNDVVGVCYPGRAAGEIGLIWSSGMQIPATPGTGPGIYYRDDANGTAALAPVAGSQRLFFSDGAVSVVGLSYTQS